MAADREIHVTRWSLPPPPPEFVPAHVGAEGKGTAADVSGRSLTRRGPLRHPGSISPKGHMFVGGSRFPETPHAVDADLESSGSAVDGGDLRGKAKGGQANEC